EHEVSYSLPALTQPTAIEGVRRLIAYQGVAYARLYLDRLRAVIDAHAACGTPGRLLKEVARQLAVRMSYEDVVRVAQAKIAPSRMRRIAREELRVQDEPFSVHDFLKPGIEELSQLLPPFLARPILAVSERRGWLGRVYFGMEINSTSISGYLRFLMLAKLRWLRPHGHRFKQEQAQIESWLSLIAEAARQSGALALEVAECARLIKGYGDTYARGLANYRSIEARVIRPALAGQIPLGRAADALASARTAALVDPEGARRMPRPGRPRRPGPTRGAKAWQMPGRDRLAGQFPRCGGIALALSCLRRSRKTLTEELDAWPYHRLGANGRQSPPRRSCARSPTTASIISSAIPGPIFRRSWKRSAAPRRPMPRCRSRSSFRTRTWRSAWRTAPI